MFTSHLLLRSPGAEIRVRNPHGFADIVGNARVICARSEKQGAERKLETVGVHSSCPFLRRPPEINIVKPPPSFAAAP